MSDATTTLVGKPVWVDLSSSDPEASRRFYSKLFGWQIDVNPDPQYGGYAMAKLGGDVAGIGPKMMPEAPTAWAIYIGTDDVEELARKVQAAGGSVVAGPMDVGDQGRMAVFQDPIGAFIAAWQSKAMAGFTAGTANTFGWAELNGRGVEKAIPFYRTVFGWDIRQSDMGPNMPPYTEFLAGGESVAGAQEMMPGVPGNVPSYWLAYFLADDVDGAYRTALGAGGQGLQTPMDFPGGRFAVVADPQGAAFGLLKMTAA